MPVADLSRTTIVVATFKEASYRGGLAGAFNANVCAPVNGSIPELANIVGSSTGLSNAVVAKDQSGTIISGLSDIVLDSLFRGSFTHNSSS